MRATESASRQNQQPLPAQLDVSPLLALRFMSGCEEFEARFSPSLREGVKKTLRDWSVFRWLGLPVLRSPDHRITRSPDSSWLGLPVLRSPDHRITRSPDSPWLGLPVLRSPDHRITRSPDHPILLTLPPRPRSCARKQPVSNPLASGVSSLESRRLAARSHAASVPLAVKPFEINGSSGPAAWRPFFVKKNKAAAFRALFFHTFVECERTPRDVAISRSGQRHYENLGRRDVALPRLLRGGHYALRIRRCSSNGIAP